ncbi:MAG: hypothetical protein B6243_08925 [Anaerolineaceae bacterium 4572_5.2]|nr:MAG: hypothetical protein B6243_08925 [Anaerolineaceae bacterium 4572_5.2]
MTQHPLAGIYAASLTPLKTDFTPDLGPVPVYLNFLAKRGCHGALLLGTTGEGPSFSPPERKALFQAAVAVRQQRPDFRLLAGTGTPSLQETIDLNKAAFNLGFEGVVVLPPFYFRKASDEGLFNWFDAVIRQSVPEGKYLLGYHIPNVSGVPLSLDLLSRLKEAHPVKFAGIKDSSHDLDHAQALGERFGKDLLVFTGTDSYLLQAMAYHAQGCITAPANLISPELRALWDTLNAEKDGSTIQGKITVKREILEKYMPFPPILKALAARLHNFPRWSLRPPLLATPNKVVEAALQELDNAEKNLQ